MSSAQIQDLLPFVTLIIIVVIALIIVMIVMINFKRFSKEKENKQSQKAPTVKKEKKDTYIMQLAKKKVLRKLKWFHFENDAILWLWLPNSWVITPGAVDSDPSNDYVIAIAHNLMAQLYPELILRNLKNDRISRITPHYDYSLWIYDLLHQGLLIQVQIVAIGNDNLLRIAAIRPMVQ